jgi:hypothetical protein
VWHGILPVQRDKHTFGAQTSIIIFLGQIKEDNEVIPLRLRQRQRLNTQVRILVKTMDVVLEEGRLLLAETVTMPMLGRTVLAGVGSVGGGACPARLWNDGYNYNGIYWHSDWD